MKTSFLLGVTILVIVCLNGCLPRKGPSENYTQAIEKYSPASTLPPNAVLALPGAKIPVDVRCTLAADIYSVDLLAFGEVVETERYRSSPTRFALIEALGETYEPETPLLGDGASSNGAWKWEGVIASGGVTRKARAELFSTPFALDTFGYQGESRKITMNMKIESGDTTVAERTLIFVFVPGKGLLKREFGEASTRSPSEPPGSISGSGE